MEQLEAFLVLLGNRLDLFLGFPLMGGRPAKRGIRHLGAGL